MSENPVRKASEKAAKEIWVLKNTSSVPSEIQSQMADIIESKFAPVVAAAEEAMRDKCEAECEVIMQSREEGDAKGISAANLCAMAISLIPTGTALAEYVERATAPLVAELNRIKSGRPPEHGPLTEDEVEHRVEQATAELRAVIVQHISNGCVFSNDLRAALSAPAKESEK